jgi:hypothetical protein
MSDESYQADDVHSSFDQKQKTKRKVSPLQQLPNQDKR